MGLMHGVHKSSAGLMQTVTVPVAKAAERSGSVRESFWLTWQKEIKSQAESVPCAKNDAGATKDDTNSPKGQIATVKSSVALAKGDSAAIERNAISEEKDAPATKLDTSDEKVEAAEDHTGEIQAGEAVEQSKEIVPVVAQLSSKTVVVAQVQKKLATMNGQVEMKKQKASEGREAVVITPDTKPQGDIALEDVNLVVAPMPVAVVQIVAAAAPKGEAKGVAKTDAATAKKDRGIVASVETGKANVVDTKAEVAEAEALLAAAAETKPFAVTAAPAALSHAVPTVTNLVETNGGTVQGMIATVAPGVAHKATMPVSTELQSASTATASGDVNAVHALSVGPGQLEVGVLDGTHGWLKIRAEMGTDGSVSAMLTSSATAHEALKQTVPQLAGYLVSESVNVGKIAVHQAAESSAAGGDLANNGSGSSARDGGADQGYRGGARGVNLPMSEASQDDMDSVMDGISAAVFGAGTRFSGNGIGSWLSVTA